MQYISSVFFFIKMTDGIVTAISYLCTLIGFGATAAYAVTFYLTNYNEIHYVEDASYDNSDLPYTLAIVECCLSGATFIIGVLAFAGKPNKRVLLVAALLFVVAMIMEGTFGIVRAWNLGLFGDDMEGTCSDVALTGCPTTRYEAVVGHEIEFRSPSGGDCQFWFWDNMDARYTGDNACGGWGATQTPGCSDKIENYMDWTKASSYGWRDDPAAVAAASAGNLVTIDKVHNMKLLFELQTELQNSSAIAAPYSKQPSIAYCWYWGCSEVCQTHRFRVNRWWLISSVSLCVIHVICLAMSLVARRRTPAEESKKSGGLPITNPANPGFMVPEMGRRKRRLVQNPSGLQF